MANVTVVLGSQVSLRNEPYDVIVLHIRGLMRGDSVGRWYAQYSSVPLYADILANTDGIEGKGKLVLIYTHLSSIELKSERSISYLARRKSVRVPSKSTPRLCAVIKKPANNYQKRR